MNPTLEEILERLKGLEEMFLDELGKTSIFNFQTMSKRDVLKSMIETVRYAKTGEHQKIK